MDRLEEIRARAEKATPEPWELRSSAPYGDGKTVFHGRFKENYTVMRWPWKYGNTESDADFIAHARSDIPYLLTELQALREENEKLTQANHQHCAVTQEYLTLRAEAAEQREAALRKALLTLPQELECENGHHPDGCIGDKCYCGASTTPASSAVLAALSPTPKL